MSNDEQIQLSHNRQLSRYEIHVNDELAGFLDYQRVSGLISLPHTEIDPSFSGRGLGSQLVQFALDDITASGGNAVDPECPFVADWIDQHPDYAYLVKK